MSWSISYLPLVEPQGVRRYLGQVGRALYLATMYEDRCKFLLKLSIADRHMAAEKSLAKSEESAANELAKADRDKLFRTIEGFAKFAKLDSATETQVLNDAREARNWIAHSSAAIGSLSSARRQSLNEQRTILVSKVEDLARGDILVSTWLEYLETSSGNWSSNLSAGLRESYPRFAKEWVLKARVPKAAK